MNLQAAKQALADQLHTETGVEALTDPPSEAVPPVFFIETDRGDYRIDLSADGMRVLFNVWLVLGSGDIAFSQGEMDAYLSPSGTSSVFAAVESDPTLGATVDSAVVTGFDSVGLVTIGTNQFVGARFIVEVLD